MAYAAKTTVSPERTRNEIETMLKRYGAEEFGYATRASRAAVQFSMHDRRVRLEIALPVETDPTFATTETGKRRTDLQRQTAFEQAVRQRWRALKLVIQAKLEAVESGIVTFEQEFFAHILLPGGSTVYEQAAPALAAAYESGSVPPLLQIGGA